MKNKPVFFAILLWVMVSSLRVLSQNYDADYFPIGVWSIKGDFRPVDEFLYNPETAAPYHETSFQNLKDEGFNTVFLSYDPIGYTLDTILNIAESHNMKVIASMQHLYEVVSQSNEQEVSDEDIIQAIENDSINRLKQSPAVMGYYLYDEPLPGWIDFDVLQNARNILTQMTADAPHPILSVWNDEQHMTYIDSYLNLDVLMMDTYPFEDGDPLGDISDYMPSYFAEGDPMPFSDYLSTVYENHCKEQNRPMWVVFQAFGDLESPENGGYWRQVDPKEIRLQVYLSIMQGAKGIWYFLYESEYPYLLGMLDVSGQPTQRLTEATAVNHEINAISSTLLKLRVVDNQSVIGVDYGQAKLHEDPGSANNDKYIICVNTDIFEASNPTLSIEKAAIGYEVQSVVDMYTNENIPFTETSNYISFTTNILEGSGRLIKLSDENLSVPSIYSKDQIQLYPNPVKDKLYIQSRYSGITSYALYTMMGKLIEKNNIAINEPINVDKLAEGVYTLQLTTQNNRVFSYKFIKI